MKYVLAYHGGGMADTSEEKARVLDSGDHNGSR